MTVESDLVALLRADAGVAALVSDRIWPNRMPDDAQLPGIVYLVTSTVDDVALGAVHQTVRTVRYDCWAGRYETALAVAAAVAAALTLKSTATIDRILPAGGFDAYDTDAGLWRRSVAFDVHT